MFFSSNDDLKDELRNAEAEMLKLAQGFDEHDAGGNQAEQGKVDYEIEIVETTIPRSVVPFKPNKQEEGELTIHAIRVTSKRKDRQHGSMTTTPLVLLHGYMNASCFFYRNLVGLSQKFETIYVLDMLGWGLSSRPEFDLADDSVECAQDFFVESLEAWRKNIGVDKMILAGHSMGGYLSVAYCERYPQYMERVVLISPVGVPEETEEIRSRRKSRFSTSRRLAFSLYSVFFHNPCSMIRMLPRYKGRQYMISYVTNRLPTIKDPEEQAAFAEYLYLNCALPVSGAQCLNQILNAFAYAKKPLLHRIPLLKVSNVFSCTDQRIGWVAMLHLTSTGCAKSKRGRAVPRHQSRSIRFLKPDIYSCWRTGKNSMQRLVLLLQVKVPTRASQKSQLEELTSNLDGDGSLDPQASMPTSNTAPEVFYS